MIKYIKKNFSILIFVLSSITSYFIFLIYYDSTTGLDFPTKYFSFINYFAFGNDLFLSDGQSFLYYYLISLFVKFNQFLIGPNNLNEILNQSIQFGNFLLILVGYLGLINLYRLLGLKLNTILVGLSILSFFPPLIYLRLTFKSEILAFTILPWLFFFINKSRNTKLLTFEIIIFSILFAILLTTKASVTAMILVILIFYIRFFLNHYHIIFYTLIISSILLYFNYSFSDYGFLTHASDISGRWQYKAGLEFFTQFDLMLLLKEPFFNIHSNSLISIILLDTYSDYFRWFWNHKEITNYLAYEELNITNNFFIQRYLREYLGVILSIITYFGFIFSYKKSNESNKILYLLPFAGIFVLILNSLGIPSLNFDPTTGDTFKTHYYSFLISISFLHLLLMNKKNLRISIFLIPLFIFLMGFPKTNIKNLEYVLELKIANSNLCYVINSKTECKDQVFNTCLRDKVILSKNNYQKVSNYYYFLNPFALFNENGESIFVRNKFECMNKLNEGFKYRY